MKKSELKNLTLTELKSYAKEKNIKKYSKLNKEELINYIINYKKIIKGGANGNENSNAKTNITVASNNTLMSNINKKQKLQDCYEKLDVLSQFYLFYSKINVYFNLYKELYKKTKGKNATKNMTIFENENSSIYICKNIIKNINNAFYDFLHASKNKYKQFTKPEEQKAFKIAVNAGIDITYKCAIYTNDDIVKNKVCWHYPVTKCGRVSGALRRISKIAHKAINLMPHFSRPTNINEIKEVFKNIRNNSFDPKFLSLSEINLLAEIGKLDPEILNEKTYKVGDKFLYNPIEKYCNNIHRNSNHENIHTKTHTSSSYSYGHSGDHSSTYILIDPFRPYGPPYYGQPYYNPYYGPYAAPYGDPYYGSMYGPSYYGPGYGYGPGYHHGPGVFNSMGHAISNGATTAYDGISSGLHQGYEGVTGFNYSGTASKIGNFGQNAVSKVGNFGQNAVTKIGDFNYSGTASQIGQFGQNSVSQIGQFGQNAMSTLGQANYAGMASQVGDAFSSGASGIGEFASSIDIGYLLDGLVQFGNIFMQIVEAFGSLIGALLSAIPS